ncbi:DNA-processing protein DprA [Cobetia marina]
MDDNEGAKNKIKLIAAYEELCLKYSTNYSTLWSFFQASNLDAEHTLLKAGYLESTVDKLILEVGEEHLREVGVLLKGKEKYPQLMNDVKNSPQLLYYLGNPDLLKTKTIAIIGSREASFEGQQRAHKIAKLLVEHDYTLVSGLADGIDTIVHQTAVLSGGNTIAVIGTPTHKSYPKKNSSFQSYISKNHLLISQIPYLYYSGQSYKANSRFFPERNATMSGISNATIIIEAKDKSGTLTQARHAIRQGRKLFILNSCFEDKTLTWPNEYLNLGAVKVNDISDITNNMD